MPFDIQQDNREQGPNSAGAFSAPSIDIGRGVPSAFTGYGDSFNGVFSPNSFTPLTPDRGFRYVLPSSVDLSNRTYFGYGIFTGQPDVQDWLPIASGGGVLIFVDNLGNYSAYNIWGNDWGGLFSGQAESGDFTAFRSFGCCIETGTTPDYQSTTAADMGNITAYEVHTRSDFAGTRNMDMSVGGLCTFDNLVVTGSESWETFSSAYNAPNGNFQAIFDKAYAFRRTAESQRVCNETFVTQFGFELGDGTTTTTMNETDFQLGVWEHGFTTNQQSPWLNISSNRRVRINQSASCSTTWTRYNFTNLSDSTALLDFIVTGNTSGTVNLTDGNHISLTSCQLGHGTYTRCSFVNIEEGVTATSNVIANACSIRDHGSGVSALTITTGAGDYSSQEWNFDNNTLYDLVLGSGGAGTYDFRGISVASGYTLKVRNNSATNAITVQLPTGITVTTSTAGGSITIDNAATVTLRITAVDDTGSPIQGARVYIEAGAGGPLTAGDVILQGLTNASGIVEDTSFVYTSDQPLQNSKIRKGTTAPRYKEAVINGPIGSGGLISTITMVSDE